MKKIIIMLMLAGTVQFSATAQNTNITTPPTSIYNGNNLNGNNLNNTATPGSTSNIYNPQPNNMAPRNNVTPNVGFPTQNSPNNPLNPPNNPLNNSTTAPNMQSPANPPAGTTPVIK